MVSFREAQEIVMARAQSFGIEGVPLGEAFGRVLAEPVRADRDYPPFPRATMDGYALRYDDLKRGMRRFHIVETLFAGSQAVSRIGSGECYKIMTGAAVPGDADMVIRREDVVEGDGEGDGEGNGEGNGEGIGEGIGEGNREGGWERSGEGGGKGGGRRIGEGGRKGGTHMEVGAKEPEPWRPFLNISRQGEDLRAGDLIIGLPCQCRPTVMGLLATLGRSMVTVARLPRVGLVTTGGEVVEPGSPVSPVQIRNSNRWMLEGALRREGIKPQGTSHVPDQPEVLTRVLEEFLSFEMLIITGGVSAGDADYVPRVLAKLGVRQLFHMIAMRPGKPTWCGVSPSGGMVFALPGNPFSCLVNFVLLIAPYLRACWGLGWPAPMSLPLAAERKKRTPLDEFFPVRVEGMPAQLVQMPLNGSGDIRLGMEANALALHPAGSGDLEAGAKVIYYSFA